MTVPDVGQDPGTDFRPPEADHQWVQETSTTPGGGLWVHAVWHRDGIPWDEAAAPPRWHRHRAQTVGWDGPPRLVRRCACGATDAGHGWTRLDHPRVRPLRHIRTRANRPS